MNQNYSDKILLVDDDIAFLKVASRIISAKGYSVDVAENAAQTLAQVQRQPYNLAILDVNLPDKSGVELLSSIVSIQPDIIAIILTGFSSVENSVRSLNSGAFAYLEKPVSPDNLLDVIRRGLEKQHLVFENRCLLKELEYRNRDLNILLSLTQTVSCSVNPEHIVNRSLEIVSKSLRIDGSYMIMLNGSYKGLPRFLGFSKEMIETLKQTVVNEGYLNYISKQSEPLVVSNIVGKSGKLLECLARDGYRSFIAIPLAAADDSSGFLGIATRIEYEFTAMEINLLRAISREIAIAITNARLFEEASNARALRELDNMRTELLANVSHELRTPLSAIKGFASSLLQPDITFDDETRQSFIRTIDSEADRLKRLIDDLLLMSRIEAGAYKARKDWYDMAEIISSLKDRLYTLTVNHNLSINLPDDLPLIQVDGSRIGEVVTNLIENAVKYSPEGGKIRLEVEKQGDYLVTSVIDNGVGIPEEYKDTIFDRFNQLAMENGHKKSCGLGLCICRGIIESHNGRIWVESRLGKGSKFRFSLPINIEPEASSGSQLVSSSQG